MTRTVTMTLFLSVAITLVSSAHYYIWTRLVRDPQFPVFWTRLATGLVVMVAVAVIAAPVSARLFHYPYSRLVSAAAFTWLGALFLLLLMLLSADLLRWGQQFLARLANGEGAADPERRLFLARVLAAAAATGAAALTAKAVWAATQPPSVVRVEVPLSRLPAAMDGFRIVQVSDLHVSTTIRRPYVAAVVAMVNALKPDLVAITGDLVDGSVPILRDDVAPLADLHAEHGVFFVTGNHEYYSGADEWLAETERLGMRNLRNERVNIGPEGAGFDLAGIDDASAHNFGGGHGADLKPVIAGRDPARELVMLAHQPKAIFEVASTGAGLMLSGHTHGGQLWPWAYLVALDQPYVAGLAKHEQTWIYVSRGTGYWGPPMRLGAPHEITEIILRHVPTPTA